MLVLTRKCGEAITLTAGDTTIRIVITTIDGNRARIGVDAPASVHVRRDELAPLEPARTLPMAGRDKPNPGESTRDPNPRTPRWPGANDAGRRDRLAARSRRAA